MSFPRQRTRVFKVDYYKASSGRGYNASLSGSGIDRVGFRYNLRVNPGEKRAIIFALGSFFLGILLIFAGRFALHSSPLSPERFPKTEETYIKRTNLNAATAEELELLPGIGPKTAERIIELRESKGKFTRIEELLEIKGMSEKKLEAIRPFIEIR